MANYIARTVTENPAYMQAKVRVPAGKTYHAGNVVVAEALDTGLGYGNWDVYAPTTVADITKEDIVLVLNNGFETLKDGRRPDGQPDYTQYTFNEGEVVTAHRLLPEVRFEISVDACDATVSGAAGLAVGDNLIPANGKDVLVYSAKATEVTAKNYLTIEAIKYFRLGGQFGGDFAKTLVVRAKQTV